MKRQTAKDDAILSAYFTRIFGDACEVELIDSDFDAFDAIETPARERGASLSDESRA